MFLDDEIVEMVMESKQQDIDSEIALVKKIVDLCDERMREELLKDCTDKNILPSVRKVCNLWNSAAITLEKKGYPYLAIDGYKNYLLARPELAKTLIPLGF